jgi:hypothetical protein
MGFDARSRRFSPESVTNMGRALDGAVDLLGIGPRDETQTRSCRSVHYQTCRSRLGVDAASLSDKAVMALESDRPRISVHQHLPGLTIETTRLRQFAMSLRSVGCFDRAAMASAHSPIGGCRSR